MEPKRIILYLVGKIPCFGGFPYLKWTDSAPAFGEFAFVGFFTQLPILCSTIFIILTNNPAPSPWYVALFHSLNAGEIFIYAVAFLSPVLYIMYEFHEDKVKFPDYLWFLSAILVVIVFSTLIYGAQKADIIRNHEFLKWSAVGFYILSAALWLISLIYQRNQVHFVEIQRQSETKLSAAISNFHP